MNNTRLRRDESGASLAEYALVLALIAVACLAALGNTGETVRTKLDVDFAGAVYSPFTIIPPKKGVESDPGISGTDVSHDGTLAAAEIDPKGTNEKHVDSHPGGATVEPDVKH